MDKPDQRVKEVKNEALQASWGPQPETRPHHQTQIAPGHMDQQTFEDSSMSPQIGATQAAGLIAMSERSLHQFAPFSQESLAPRAANPSAIGVHRLLFRRLVLPATPALVLRLGRITANSLLL